jgi:hypothetical protein
MGISYGADGVIIVQAAGIERARDADPGSPLKGGEEKSPDCIHNSMAPKESLDGKPTITLRMSDNLRVCKACGGVKSFQRKFPIVLPGSFHLSSLDGQTASYSPVEVA